MAGIEKEIQRIKREISSLKRELISLYYLMYFEDDIEGMYHDIERFIKDLDSLRESKSKNDK